MNWEWLSELSGTGEYFFLMKLSDCSNKFDLLAVRLTFIIINNEVSQPLF